MLLFKPSVSGHHLSCFLWKLVQWFNGRPSPPPHRKALHPHPLMWSFPQPQGVVWSGGFYIRKGGSHKQLSLRLAFSLLSKDVEYFKEMCVLAISVVELSIQVLCPFLNYVVCPLVAECTLYIYCICMPKQIYVCKHFLPFCGWFFSFLVFFEAQNFLILKFNFFYSPFP